MIEPVELKPCPNPWCEAGERDGDFRPKIHYSNFGLVYVACTSCNMGGPTRQHEAEAIAAWNRRALPEPAADLVEVAARAVMDAADEVHITLANIIARAVLTALTPHIAAREHAAHNAAIEAAADDEATLTLVGLAIERAGCPGREGPFGGYDYGYKTEFYGPAPAAGRYVIRDFRDPASPDWGKPIHYTPDEDAHNAMFAKLTQHHIARAAILALKEPRP